MVGLDDGVRLAAGRLRISKARAMGNGGRRAVLRNTETDERTHTCAFIPIGAPGKAAQCFPKEGLKASQ